MALPGLEKSSPLFALSKSRFGGATTLRVTTVTVGTAVVRVLENNPRRVHYFLENLSAFRIAVDFARPVAIGTGFAIDPDGGFFSMTQEEDGEAVGLELLGIGDSTALSLKVLEILRL